jgi:capsule polysaccharide export protein KpsE/RkpR
MVSIKAKIAILCLVLPALVLKQARAQSWDEWFHQKKTQIKYLEQQIAALKAEEISLRQGYDMLKSEWNAIAGFKNGEFSLHQGYYQSLSEVKPEVRSSANLSAIQAEQQSVISQLNAIRNLNGLADNEQAYVSEVSQNLVAQLNRDLDDLQSVLTTGELQMGDDERIRRLQRISASIKDKYVFTCSFCRKVQLLCAQRQQDNHEMETLRRYYEVK